MAGTSTVSLFSAMEACEQPHCFFMSSADESGVRMPTAMSE